MKTIYLSMLYLNLAAIDPPNNYKEIIANKLYLVETEGSKKLCDIIDANQYQKNFLTIALNLALISLDSDFSDSELLFISAYCKQSFGSLPENFALYKLSKMNKTDSEYQQTINSANSLLKDECKLSETTVDNALKELKGLLPNILNDIYKPFTDDIKPLASKDGKNFNLKMFCDELSISINSKIMKNFEDSFSETQETDLTKIIKHGMICCYINALSLDKDAKIAFNDYDTVFGMNIMYRVIDEFEFQNNRSPKNAKEVYEYFSGFDEQYKVYLESYINGLEKKETKDRSHIYNTMYNPLAESNYKDIRDQMIKDGEVFSRLFDQINTKIKTQSTTLYKFLGIEFATKEADKNFVYYGGFKVVEGPNRNTVSRFFSASYSYFVNFSYSIYSTIKSFFV